MSDVSEVKGNKTETHPEGGVQEIPAARASRVLSFSFKSLQRAGNPLFIGGSAAVFVALAVFEEVGSGSAALGFCVVILLYLIAPVFQTVSIDEAEAERIASDLTVNAPATELTEVVSALPGACFLLSIDGEVISQNEAARRLTAPVEMGQHISAVLRAPDVLEAIGKAAAERLAQSVNYFERVPVNRWLEAHVAYIGSDSTGAESVEGARELEKDWLLLLLTDLTQQQRVERMRADFVANASHELRTPLASLLGFIETLQGPARDDAEARARFLEIMREQASRMARLITDLMSLSRIEQNAHVRPEAVIDLNSIIGHVTDAMSVLAQEHGVELRVRLPDDGPLRVQGDRDELTQVVQNLVDNAVKYGEAGKRVDITVRRVPPVAVDGLGRIEIEVRDYGPGIPPEHVPRLTERFYRVDVAYSREKGGTGLGLAIVKHILNRHRGQLLIESEPGDGAVFTVRLEPVDASASVRPAA